MAARLAALQADNRALAFDAASLSDRIEALNIRIAACHMHSSPGPVKGASGRRPGVGVGPTAPSDTIPSSAPSAPSAPSASTPPLGGGPLQAVQPAVGTDRLYFQDTYRFTADATVVSLKTSAPDDDKCVLVLNKTVFHPQGGGQPADTGTISGDGWGFAVEHVTVQKEDNIVEHHGRFVGGGANSSGLVGTAVKLSVDDVSRRLHARLHSAGHLLDAALVNLGRTDLEPGKGYHFTAGPYVEYIGAVSVDDKDALAAAVSAECQRLIEAAIPTVVTMDVDGTTGYATRIVNVGGCTCPCGGTHVQNTTEIKSITVTRIKKVKKNVKFSYTIG